MGHSYQLAQAAWELVRDPLLATGQTGTCLKTVKYLLFMELGKGAVSGIAAA